MDHRISSADVLHSYVNLPPRSSIKLRDRIVDYQVAEMAVLFRTGELTAEQLTIAYLARTYEFDSACGPHADYGGYNAFVHIDAQQALTQARLADQWLSSSDDPRGPAPVLCGIVLGARELFSGTGQEGRNGRLASPGKADSALFVHLRDQGAVLLGHRLNPTTTRNISTDFAAIAPVNRLCAATLAEVGDDGLIIPAAANGASAIKPSAGLVPGCELPGSIARSVRDASLILATLGSSDPLPAVTQPGATPLAGLNIGVPALPVSPFEADYRQAFERLRRQLSTLGARLLEFPDPLPQTAQRWESALRSHGLDFMLVMAQGSPAGLRDASLEGGEERYRLASIPGWPMVTFPISHGGSGALRSWPINATFCGPPLSDWQIIQAALDFQAHYPQYHDTAPSVPAFGPPPRKALPGYRSEAAPITAPRKAWPTG
ncbi:hypothetical protein PS3A_05350 [Pseudomonas sp. 3A(2025)]